MLHGSKVKWNQNEGLNPKVFQAFILIKLIEYNLFFLSLTQTLVHWTFRIEVSIPHNTIENIFHFSRVKVKSESEEYFKFTLEKSWL